MSPRKKRQGKGGTGPRARPLDVDLAEIQAIIERTRVGPLSAEESAILEALMHTVAFVTAELQSKRTSIARLRALLFGAKTERTRDVLGRQAQPGAGGDTAAGAQAKARPKAPGHGRRRAAAYTGAETVAVPHPSLHPGDPCPGCPKGRIHPLPEPVRLVRIRGMAPLAATVYEKEHLRCNLCGEVFTAPSPPGVGEQKYDETATAMVALLKYGTGLPFHRIERLQAGLGIPLPASTQWELVRDGAEALAPAHEALVRQAAQGEVLYNDDTTAKILDLTPKQRAAAAADEQTDERTGVFTSGIVATGDGHPVALFCTGVQHAGENLADVLARREPERPRPIQMSDALSSNTCGDFDAIVARCTAHARRKYVEVAGAFPEECAYVLEQLAKVYQHDAEARRQGLSPSQRLEYHQEHSEPVMAALETWMQEQLDERRVEPNSGLGKAIAYMQNHWDGLTLFLREPGAPLDNNLCERALKKAILHRKNALFFKTQNGARVADLYMSFIHTCELNEVNPFDYLVALLQHHEALAQAPADWMPWSYRAALAALGADPDPPPP